MKLPKHVAIIPDGNRRWAQKQSLRAFFGHDAGAENSEKILTSALELKIPYLTMWGSSLDNIKKRPSVEVKYLYSVFENHFKRLLTESTVDDYQVRVRVLGRWPEFFPERLKKIIREVIDKTASYRRHHLTLLMAYDGLDEMKEAIQNITKQKNHNPNLKITDQVIKNNLWTKDLPPVDLVIRTAGAPHWSSGFLMWDVADAKLFFTETLWPDFSVKEFKSTLESYGQEKRRFGK